MAVPFNIIALDVGEKRVGIAKASSEAKLARPIKTLNRSDTFFKELRALIEDEGASFLVIGLPQGLSGQDTDQTAKTHLFISELESQIDLPVYLEDESYSSVRAEETLSALKKDYSKADIDAQAASHILEDFINNHPEVF
ncbi:MAG TPA: Holliday junction resolvase RuvX [Candidatus Saccharimonadales bacterium]|nr:Holliday junction resolvase RuvX [Candidatus Saccharimonadales bacterium]